MNSQQRQTLFISLIILFLIIVGFLIVWFFSYSSLNIVTNSPNNTILVRQDTGTTQNQVKVDQKDNHAELRIPAGTYIVTVQNSAQSAMQIVKIGIGEHKSITLNVTSEVYNPISEPVSSFGAGGISASATALRFIDRNVAEHPLYSVDSGGNVTLLDKNTTYTNVRWADPEFGVGYGLDKNNRYVIRLIQDSEVRPVTAPFTVDINTSYGVAPDHTWYIADGHTVYRANGDGSFTKVYNNQDFVSIISLSNDALLLSQKSDQSAREGSLIILHKNGEKYQIEGGAYEAAWSPNGDKLVTSGDTSKIFDAKFKEVAKLPSGNFLSPVWLNENTILYGVDNKVMRYDIDTGSASTLLSFDQVTGTPSQIVVSQEKDYVYVAIQKGGDRSGIAFRLERIPLNNKQPTSDVPAQKLNLLIPNTVRGCDINYVNFTRFSITLQYNDGVTADCTPAVRDYLTSYDVPLQEISFQTIR